MMQMSMIMCNKELNDINMTHNCIHVYRLLIFCGECISVVLVNHPSTRDMFEKIVQSNQTIRLVEY